MALNKLNPSEVTLSAVALATARMNDGGGLALLPNYQSKPGQLSGVHRWVFRGTLAPTLGGKVFEMGLGVLADVTLAEARKQATAARQAVGRGEDRRASRVAARTAVAQAAEDSRREKAGLAVAGSFRDQAEILIAREAVGRSAEVTADWHRMFEMHFYPTFGARKLASIQRAELQTFFDNLQAGSSVVERLYKRTAAVFESAANVGAIPHNIARGLDIRKHRGGNMAAVDCSENAEPLRAVFACFDGYSSEVMRIVFDVQAYLFQRSFITASMQWAHLDLARAMWRIPGASMKRDLDGKEAGPDHFVALPRQIVAKLERMKELTGGGKYVFPNARDAERHMDADSIQEMMQAAMGKREAEAAGAKWISYQDAHGFRSLAISYGPEYCGLDKKLMDLISGHKVGDDLGTAYDRAKWLAGRRHAVQTYADWLDAVRAGDESAMLPLHERVDVAAGVPVGVDPARWARLMALEALANAAAKEPATQAA